MLPPPAVDGVPVAAPAGDALLQLLNGLAEHAAAIEQAMARVAQQMQGVTNDVADDFMHTHHRMEESVEVVLQRVVRNIEARSGVLYTLAAVSYITTGLVLLGLWPLHRACARLLLYGGRTRVVAMSGAILVAIIVAVVLAVVIVIVVVVIVATLLPAGYGLPHLVFAWDGAARN